MGKGTGDHPPEKFVHDQVFCQITVMVFMGVSITLSSLSAGMDDGGSFPFPYFFTGFVLGVILIVNLVSRWVVVRAVQNKGISRNNIVEILDKTTCGNIVWPWSCRVGMVWCIPGTILTGLGGVNCGITERNENGTMIEKVENKCYYDIEGEHGDMYRGLAIGLVVMHVFSFAWLLLSNCPTHSVLEQIKEDPRRNTVAPSARRPASNTTTPSTPAVATISQGATGGGQQDTELKALKKQLDERTKEIERRERDLAERERQILEASMLPPPPSYTSLMGIPN